MHWAETLPPDCPPEEAFSPSGEVFYRLIEGAQPSAKDFYSHSKLKPNIIYPDECIAKAVSLYDNKDSCKQIRCLPYTKKFKNKLMIEITLTSECGAIKQTSNDRHFSWWLSNSYDPLLHSRVLPD